MAEAYRSGLPVLFFPEGTTTDGAEVLPFRRGLFHSVLNEGVALRTAALQYKLESCWANDGATVGDDVCWWGEMGFVSHLFRVLGLQGLSVKVRFGDEVLRRTDRFVLSETARARVAAMYAGTGEVEQVGDGELVRLLDSLAVRNPCPRCGTLRQALDRL
jgi:1-acyl-sn-glycerol-3-phosphate acyltransferase